MIAKSCAGLLVCAWLWVGVSCLSTLSFSFNNTAASSNVVPTYPLGLLPPNTTISFAINTLNKNMDLSAANVDLVASLDYTLLSRFSCAGQTCQDYYYIPADSQPQIYYLRVYLTTTLDMLSPAFTPFYLTALSSPGPFTFARNPSQQVLIRVVDALRIGVNKFLYISTQSRVEVTLYPIDSALSTADSAVRVVQVYPDNGYLLSYGSVVSLSTDALTIVSDSGDTTYGIYKFSALLGQGYYVLMVTYDIGKPLMQLSWQADPFPCTYSSQYLDYFHLFQGCTSIQTISAGFPCLDYDSYQMLCRSCVQGYSLSQGQCIYNSSCLPRQYFSYGQCLQVSSLCGDFDLYTGSCLSCANASLVFINGSCLTSAITCGTRQYWSNNTCLDVDRSCDSFSAVDGSCLSCLNSTLFVVKGKCLDKTVNCADNQVRVGDKCADVPANCLQFHATSSSCTSCSFGFILQNQLCLKVNCPQRSVLSAKGDSCVAVSELCDRYDNITGSCLSCHSGYTIGEGKCLQAVSPLAGCAALQQMGFGKCGDPTPDCQVHNLVTGNCDQCLPSFYLDYAGHCQKAAVCSANEASVNGQCLSLPLGCIKTSSIGICAQCDNRHYRFVQGQCLPKASCSPRQYLSQGQVCVDVSPDCGQFNPSSGQCVTCLNGSPPSLGRCSSPDPSCLAYHPSLGHCLQCSPGFVPAYSPSSGPCQPQ